MPADGLFAYTRPRCNENPDYAYDDAAVDCEGYSDLIAEQLDRIERDGPCGMRHISEILKDMKIFGGVLG